MAQQPDIASSARHADIRCTELHDALEWITKVRERELLRRGDTRLYNALFRATMVISEELGASRARAAILAERARKETQVEGASS